MMIRQSCRIDGNSDGDSNLSTESRESSGPGAGFHSWLFFRNHFRRKLQGCVPDSLDGLTFVMTPALSESV